MLVHFAPMLLKLGIVFDGPTGSRGCGIVGGCGRSGSMARGLTVRTLGKLRTFCQKILYCNNSLQEEGKSVSTAIYVDDAAMVLWAKHAMAGSAEAPALKKWFMRWPGGGPTWS